MQMEIESFYTSDEVSQVKVRFIECVIEGREVT